MGKPSVLLSMPVYQSVDFDAAMMFGVGASRACDVVWGGGRYSHPEHSFNECWAEALNKREMHGLTHFAMLHSDVVPEPYWLDKLVAELEKHDADILSVVIPLKTSDGHTSTAIATAQDPALPSVDRIITIREAHRLPVTFGADAFPGKLLLVNTGCFVCRFDRDWNYQIAARAYTWIKRDKDGYAARLFPSDWDTSWQLAKLGCKVLATRVVECYHGRREWTNAKPWGTGELHDVPRIHDPV